MKPRSKDSEERTGKTNKQTNIEEMTDNFEHYWKTPNHRSINSENSQEGLKKKIKLRIIQE